MNQQNNNKTDLEEQPREKIECPFTYKQKEKLDEYLAFNNVAEPRDWNEHDSITQGRFRYIMHSSVDRGNFPKTIQKIIETFFDISVNVYHYGHSLYIDWNVSENDC